MGNLENALFLVATVAAFWIFKQYKAQKHPARLQDLYQALRTQADLWLYRNSSPENSARLNKLADDLDVARSMVNDSPEYVRKHWLPIRPRILGLTDEALLKEVNLLYSDRREEIKAAVGDLVDRIDKIEERAPR